MFQTRYVEKRIILFSPCLGVRVCVCVCFAHKMDAINNQQTKYLNGMTRTALRHTASSKQ